MKNLIKLKGVQELKKNELLSINGGTDCSKNPTVPPGHGVCAIGNCYVVYPCTSRCPDGTDPICGY